MVNAHENTDQLHHSRLGPHGLGDPNDKSLRKVELEVLIPKIMREKARLANCLNEVTEFNNCCVENGISLVLRCRQENAKMKECLTYWYRNPEFQQICREEYLKERSEYRLTGIPKKFRNKSNS